jgi:hypothetical protein
MIKLSNIIESTPSNIDPSVQIHPIIVKTSTILEQFNELLFNIMVNEFASQPLEAITIESFKAKAAQIKHFFSEVEFVYIGTMMIDAIQEKHRLSLSQVEQVLRNRNWLS